MKVGSNPLVATFLLLILAINSDTTFHAFHLKGIGIFKVHVLLLVQRLRKNIHQSCSRKRKCTCVCIRVVPSTCWNGNRELVITRTGIREYLIHRKCAGGGSRIRILDSHKAEYIRRRSAHGRFHYLGPVESGTRLWFARLRIQYIQNIRPGAESLSASSLFPSHKCGFLMSSQSRAFSFTRVNIRLFR